eukprot:1370679-Ditylum_brightwellii.AAC.1
MYHWVRSWVNKLDSPFVITAIDTDMQKADILTKPLGKNIFPGSLHVRGGFKGELQAGACTPSGTQKLEVAH